MEKKQVYSTGSAAASPYISQAVKSVSYTHLDVYKRQNWKIAN